MSTPKAKWCQKCGYVRKEEDAAPDYECPQCGAVYAKIQAANAPTTQTAPPTVLVYNRKPLHANRWALRIVFLAIGVAIAVGVVGYAGRSSQPSPPDSGVKSPAPTAAVTATTMPVSAVEPPPDRFYEDALEYAQDKISVTLNGEEHVQNIKVQVINRGKQEVASLTIRVRGTKNYVIDSTRIKEETLEDREMELTGGPYPPGETKDFYIPFPKGMSTLVFAPRSMRDNAMEFPHSVPITRANF